MKFKVHLLQIALALFSNHSYAKAIDLNEPFFCKDISHGKIVINNVDLQLDGQKFKGYGNVSNSSSAFNYIFFSDDGMVEINVMQDSKTGSVDVSYIKYSVSINNLPLNSRYKDYIAYEKISYKAGLPGKHKLLGEQRGCANTN